MATSKILTYTEFRTRRMNFNSNQPSYLQVESDFEGMTKNIYENYYLKGKVPQYAKQ